MTTPSLTRQVLALQAYDRAGEKWIEESLEMLYKHRKDYATIVCRFPSKKEKDIKHNFACVIREMFKDKKVSGLRIKSVFAFALYIQELYGIDMHVETSSLLEEYVYGWVQDNGD